MSKFHPLAPASGGKEEENHDTSISILSHGCPSAEARKDMAQSLMTNQAVAGNKTSKMA